MISPAAQLAIAAIRHRAKGKHSPSNHPISINFHPDRLDLEGRPLLQRMASDGVLKSQFETGTSNGGLSAQPGGDRYLWEQRIFAAAYDEADDAQRPKYGALNVNNSAAGAAPRFGSACIVLAPQLLERSTFCFPDSYLQPEAFATQQNLGELIELAEHTQMHDALDHYIEAQIHGDIVLARDVACIVLDPSFKHSAIEQQAKALRIPLRWHAGFALNISQLKQHSDYRGQRIVDLAQSMTTDNSLNPEQLGAAVNAQYADAQDLKKLWHCMARFGYQAHQ